MTNGIFESGFDNTNPSASNNLPPEQYAANPNAAFSASDVSTQGNAGFNAEGSYDQGVNGRESGAYGESDLM